MKTKTLIIIGFFILLIGGCFYFFTKEVTHSFAIIHQKLEDKFLQQDSSIEIDFLRLENELSQENELKPFKDSLRSLHNSYQFTIDHLNYSSIKLQTIAIMADGSSVSKSSKKYLFGDQPESNKHSGNGQAYRIRRNINDFYFRVAHANVAMGFISSDSLLVDLPFLGNKIVGTNKISVWEKASFSGPIGGDLAKLVSLKLDVQKFWQKELELIRDKVLE